MNDPLSLHAFSYSMGGGGGGGGGGMQEVRST